MTSKDFLRCDDCFVYHSIFGKIFADNGMYTLILCKANGLDYNEIISCCDKNNPTDSKIMQIKTSITE